MAGRPKDASDKEILRAVESAVNNTDKEYVSTSKIVAESPLKHKGTLLRLKQLAEDGYLTYDDLGNGYLWYLSDSGRAYLSGELDASDLKNDKG